MAHCMALYSEGTPFAGVYLYQKNENELGLFCAVRAEQPENGVIFSTKDCKAVKNLSCAAYDDPTGVTRQRLIKLTKALRPRWQWEDKGGQHKLWVINDTVTIEALRKDFADRTLRLYAGQEQYNNAVTAQKGRLLPQGICLFLTESEGLLPPEQLPIKL